MSNDTQILGTPHDKTEDDSFGVEWIFDYIRNQFCILWDGRRPKCSGRVELNAYNFHKFDEST